MKPGTYFIGDPCYVLTDDQWMGLKPWKDGESRLADGTLLAMYGTGGDGIYEDRQGYAYGVDSGTIGCVPLDACTDKAAHALTRIARFTKPFKTCRRGDYLHFGRISIDTRR